MDDELNKISGILQKHGIGESLIRRAKANMGKDIGPGIPFLARTRAAALQDGIKTMALSKVGWSNLLSSRYYENVEVRKTITPDKIEALPSETNETHNIFIHGGLEYHIPTDPNGSGEIHKQSAHPKKALMTFRGNGMLEQMAVFAESNGYDVFRPLRYAKYAAQFISPLFANRKAAAGERIFVVLPDERKRPICMPPAAYVEYLMRSSLLAGFETAKDKSGMEISHEELLDIAYGGGKNKYSLSPVDGNFIRALSAISEEISYFADGGSIHMRDNKNMFQCMYADFRSGFEDGMHYDSAKCAIAIIPPGMMRHSRSAAHSPGI